MRINLQMPSENVWNKSIFEHFLKGLSIYLEATVYDSDPHIKKVPDPQYGT
jgi:hypothetical protein